MRRGVIAGVYIESRRLQSAEEQSNGTASQSNVHVASQARRSASVGGLGRGGNGGGGRGRAGDQSAAGDRGARVEERRRRSRRRRRSDGVDSHQRLGDSSGQSRRLSLVSSGELGRAQAEDGRDDSSELHFEDA